MLRRSFKIFPIYAYRAFRTTAGNKCKGESNEKENEIVNKKLSSSVATRFKIFKDESVGIIFDIEEERAKRRLQEEMGVTEEEEESSHEMTPSAYADFNLERGKTGVFDIEELVEVLKKETAIDVCVIKIPQKFSYVDYMCIITGSSYRHMLGMASFVRKVYKLKRHSTDPVPRIEGKECKNWMCIDLGNIALHIFSKSAREHYSLETLWTLGEEYEKRTNRLDKVEEMFEKFLSTADVKNSQ